MLGRLLLNVKKAILPQELPSWTFWVITKPKACMSMTSAARIVAAGYGVWALHAPWQHAAAGLWRSQGGNEKKGVLLKTPF